MNIIKFEASVLFSLTPGLALILIHPNNSPSGNPERTSFSVLLNASDYIGELHLHLYLIGFGLIWNFFPKVPSDLLIDKFSILSFVTVQTSGALAVLQLTLTELPSLGPFPIANSGRFGFLKLLPSHIYSFSFSLVVHPQHSLAIFIFC